jgi:light-regulated signal transduction histidine kinase (bacteriophytochrome)
MECFRHRQNHPDYHRGTHFQRSRIPKQRDPRFSQTPYPCPLALSIVKKMVEAMNGKVRCESELGHGATFIVEFPAT